MEMAKNIKLNGENFLIRTYNSERDEQKVLDLWKTVFLKDMPFNLWHWKYIDNPYETAIIICENEKGMPVVLYGGIPFKSNYCGREIKMIHLSDIMSHPNYRGSGLFIHTANYYFEVFGNMDDTFVMYGFPGKYHFDIGEKYLKYSRIGKGAYFFEESTAKIAGKKKYADGEIVRIQSYDACFDSIWRNCSQDYPLAIIRDSSYVKWRFFDHPKNHYEIWCFKDGHENIGNGYANDGYKGYAAIQIKDEKAIIVDIMVPKSKIGLHNFMIKMAGMLLERGINGLATWAPGDHFFVDLLIGIGFKRKQEPIGIIPTIRFFDTSLKNNWVFENIFYTMGDGDLM